MPLVQQSVEMKRGPECLLGGQKGKDGSYLSSCSWFCCEKRILFS